MQRIDCDRNSLSSSQRPLVLALGNFDGLHLGHQALIREAIRLAQEQGMAAGVLLFKNHTDSVFTDEPLPQLSSLEDKVSLLSQFGLDVTVEKTFCRSFGSTPPRQFIEDFLLREVGARGIVVGRDYSFGDHATGHVEDLRQAEREGKLFLSVVEDILFQGERISSSRIRNLLSQGRVEESREMLGRPYQIRGSIVTGAQRGRTLGFPTANLEVSFPYVVPANGVYLTRLHVGASSYLGMTNIGTNPTFTDEKRIKIETHLFDVSKDLYGEQVGLEFLRFERPDRRFSTAEELIAQMKDDDRLLRRWGTEEEKESAQGPGGRTGRLLKTTVETFL